MHNGCVATSARGHKVCWWESRKLWDAFCEKQISIKMIRNSNGWPFVRAPNVSICTRNAQPLTQNACENLRFSGILVFCSIYWILGCLLLFYCCSLVDALLLPLFGQCVAPSNSWINFYTHFWLFNIFSFYHPTIKRPLSTSSSSVYTVYA